MSIESTLSSRAQKPLVGDELINSPLNFGKGLWLGVLFLLLQITFIIPVAVVAFVIYGNIDQPSFSNLIIGFGVPIGLIGNTWLYCKKRSLNEMAFHWKLTNIKLIPLGLLLALCLSYIIGELTTFLPNYAIISSNYKAMFSDIHPVNLFLVIVLIGPICEEVIFRGIILEGLAKTYPPTKAIILSSIIFGFVHLQPLQIISTFFMGLVLSWVYLRTKCLWICIIIHMINNIITFKLLLIEVVSVRVLLNNDIFYHATFSFAVIAGYLAYRGFKLISEVRA